MAFFDRYLKELPEYNTVFNAADRDRLPCAVTGVSHIHKAHLINTLCDDLDRRAVVIVSDEGEATKLCEDINAMGGNALIFRSRDFSFREIDAASRQYEQERLGVLSKMINGDYKQVIACVDAALQYTVSPERLYRRRLHIKSGDSISPDSLCTELTASGYTRCELVEGAGQFARRGGIIDVFTADSEEPARIEFWGDEIDSINRFDVISQRRTTYVEELDIPPATEVLFDSHEVLAEKIEAVAKKLRSTAEPVAAAKERLLKNAQVLRSGADISGMDRFLPVMEDAPSTMLDFAADALIFVSETEKVKEKARVYSWQMSEDIKSLLEEGVLCKGLDTFSAGYDSLVARYQEQGAIFLDNFARGSYALQIRELVSLTVKNSTPFFGNVGQLYEDIKPLCERGFAFAVLAGGEKGAKLLAEDLRDKGLPADYSEKPDDVPHGKIIVTPGGLSGGFEYTASKFILITQNRPTASKTAKKRKNANGFNSLDELHKGDYVVHSVHGIGIFQGINKISNGGVTKDYITISYAGSDTLYVPVTQLDLVSKYIGPSGEDAKVKLHKLGGTEWQKTRARVRKSVKDMAKQLIALYSKRMNTKGFAFGADSDWQNDFERRFEFDETDDQLRCIDEIKYDMQRPVPMDRLLCGDVGFGKTEVALRAAFKCITEGKQCALLVPTTILAWQHYQTVLRRMEGMPVEVELLSRFRTPKQQEQTIKNIAMGKTDMVIGTHRLISDDVKFKDLGLMIVDEEQRFGVAQKERLKEKFNAVDALTLSATPIPRTLNMAMSGLRDMSIIEEAPLDRHPVQTYVIEYDSGILIDALKRELNRGGQVYYLHNRVETIERTAAGIAARIPGANVAVAHGKMTEEQLSEVWRQLIEHEIDILVCTTIIETGVDVSNVNTLVIEDADRMGLAQLHQIRGRVGRSSRRAYAYLTFRRGKELSDIATRRLSAIREFTEFGSGLKIAMRDLEIRGAGNLLGGEQHGQMEAVGYDLYLKLLADAVSEEKGEKVTDSSDCMVDIQITAHIPEDYISDLNQRLSIYRRIAEVRTEADSRDVTDELIDRFGEPPQSVLGLVKVSLLRNRAAALGIYEAVQRSENLLLFQKQPDVDLTVRLGERMKGRIMLNAGNKPYISVKLIKNQSPTDTLNEVLTHMEELKSLKDASAKQ